MKKWDLLVAGNSIALFVFIMVPAGSLYFFPSSATTSENDTGNSVCSLGCDDENEMLIAGNASGTVKMWRTGERSFHCLRIPLWTFVQASFPHYSITAVSFMQHSRKIDIGTMIDSSNGEILFVDP